MRIAVLSDDPAVRDLVRSTLAAQHHGCHSFDSEAALLRQVRNDSLDLIILDWPLPENPTGGIVRAVRQTCGPRSPILYFSRSAGEADVLLALAQGATDFMVRPLRPGELVARTAMLLQRAFPEALSARLTFGPYRFDPARRSLALHGQPVALKNLEYELALFLFRNPGRVLSRAHLREVVWGESNAAPSRSLDTHVSRLRNKLALTEANGYTLSAIYGMGYRLDPLAPGARPPSGPPATEVQHP